MRFKDLVILKPVDESRCVITSRYWDWRWTHWHRAYDWAPYQMKGELDSDFYTRRLHEKVHAGIPGKVEQIYHEVDGFGLYVKIRHLEYPIYGYKAHLSEALVEEGQIVEATTPVGIMEHTGRCYSRHNGDGLHTHDEYREILSWGRLRPFNAADYYKSMLIGFSNKLKPFQVLPVRG